MAKFKRKKKMGRRACAARCYKESEGVGALLIINVEWSSVVRMIISFVKSRRERFFGLKAGILG
jgi:hypothetical protein